MHLNVDYFRVTEAKTPEAHLAASLAKEEGREGKRKKKFLTFSAPKLTRRENASKDVEKEIGLKLLS